MDDKPVTQAGFRAGQYLALEIVVSMLLHKLSLTQEIIEAAEQQLDQVHRTQMPEDPELKRIFLDMIKVAGKTMTKLRGDGRA